MYGKMFDGVFVLLRIGIVAMVFSIIFIIYSVVDYIWLPDKIESKKLIIPTVVVETVSVDGVSKSDTTYIYIKP